MGYLGSTVAAGSILGPILGGFLVDSLGWRYIFLINLPIGIVLVACALVVSLVSLMLFFIASYMMNSAGPFCFQ